MKSGFSVARTNIVRAFYFEIDSNMKRGEIIVNYLRIHQSFQHRPE